MAEDVFGIVGSVIAGTYQVERVVAEGGFGVVYRAHHVGFRAPVALKCLKIPQQLSSAHQADFLEQFRAEAELLFRLSASIPTVVRPLHVDAVTLDNGMFVPFLALEWLEGETLDAILQSRKAQGLPPLTLKKLVRMLTPVARALERAHNFMGPDGPISIVHRDLKPENIFAANVAGEELLKILDFGIGKAKSVASQVAGRASQTHSAFSSFTPAYGAPEQWVPKRYGQTGPWTDVWGLALTLVEVMAGRTIIDGDQAGMMGTVLDEARRPTPRNEGIHVSDAVESVFLRALAVDPRERYPDAGKFWNDLVAAVGVRGEASDGFIPRARDARAESGHIPQEEHVGAAAQMNSRPAPARSPRLTPGGSVPPSLRGSSRDTPDTAPQLIVDRRTPEFRAAETQATPAEGLRQAGSPNVDARGAVAHSVPELNLDPIAPSRPRAAAAGRPAVDLDLEEAPALDLALDLEPGERASMRSAPNWPAVGRTSGTFPAGSGPSSVSSNPPRTTPSGRRSSGEHRALSDPPRSRSDPAPLGLSNHTSSPPEPNSAPRWSMPPPLDPSPQPRVSSVQPEPSFGRRLAPGVLLLLASVGLTLVDQLYAGSSGEVLTFGAVRATWIAGVLMVAGVGWAATSLVRHFRA